MNEYLDMPSYITFAFQVFLTVSYTGSSTLRCMHDREHINKLFQNNVTLLLRCKIPKDVKN